MNNKIWIEFPKNINSNLDSDLENNFQIFKLQGAPEASMSFILRKMLSANFIPTVQFYNFLSETLLMNGYYLAAENVLLYNNILLRISDNIDYSNNTIKTAINKFINLMVARKNHSVFDYMKNTLNINTTGLEEYFKAFKIDLKKGRECPFLNFSDFNLTDIQLKKFFQNDLYLIFNSNKIFKELFEKRLEVLFYDEIQILEFENNNFYSEIIIEPVSRIRIHSYSDDTPTKKAYSFLVEGMFNEAMIECLKYLVSPKFIPSVSFYVFFARILVLNGYFTDAKNILLYAIVGVLNNKFGGDPVISYLFEFYKIISDINLDNKINLLESLFKLSNTKESGVFSIFTSFDYKEKFLNFIKQENGNYIFFIKKNIIFNYKRVLVSNKVYTQISSGKIYYYSYTHNDEIHPVFKNSLIGNTIIRDNSEEKTEEENNNSTNFEEKVKKNKDIVIIIIILSIISIVVIGKS